MMKEAFKKRLEVYYQPIVDNSTQKVYKYEALARFKCGDSVLSPIGFLDFLHESGLYSYMSHLILEKVFEELRRFQNIRIAINVKMCDIANPDFRNFFYEQASHTFPQNRLTVELVESDEMDYEVTTNFIDSLKDRGIGVSLDDFGSGFANFNYLIKYDFDYLKIDGSLIKGILCKKNLVVIDGIVKICKKNNIKVVAEHVEDEIIFHEVCNLGIEYSQGYYFGKPSKEIRKGLEKSISL